MYLKSYVDGTEPEVTFGAKERLEVLEAQWGAYKEKLNQLINTEIEAFNSAYEKLDVPALWIDK